MEAILFDIARKGDVATLKRLLLEDSTLLSRAIVSAHSSETPLHVAAMEGHGDFVKEILRVKPQLAKELDCKLSSPLHLAAAMGHLGVVRDLLLADPSMCTARDRDGITPVHLAAVEGRLDVLKEFIPVISSSGLADLVAMDDQVLGESILHMCIKHSRLDSLRLLLEMARDAGDDFLNHRDSYGNTILHLAAMDKQYEVVKFLVQHTTIAVNAANSSGHTALDNLFHNVKEMEIAELLRHNGAQQAIHTQIQSLPTQSTSNNKKPRNKRNKIKRSKSNNKPYDEHWLRWSLMVVAALLLSVPFHSTRSPSYYMPECYGVFMVANSMITTASLTVMLVAVSGFSLRHKLIRYIMMMAMWVAAIATGISLFYPCT